MPHYSQSQRGFISEAGISNFVLPTDNTQNLQNLEGQDSNRTSIQPIQTRNNPIKIKKNNNLYNSFHGKGNLFSSSQHVSIGMWEECMINRDISNNLREQGYFSPLESQVALFKFANNSRPTNCYIATDIDSGKSLGIAISSANCINTKSAYIQCLLIGCSEDKCSILYKYAMQICLSTKGTVTMVKNIKEDCTIACTSHILIGTPQKLVALIDKFPSMLNKVARVYIDDANAILHVCEYQLKKIKSRLPSKCSTYILAQTDSSVPDASKLINGSIKIIQIKSTPYCFNRVKLFHILTDNKMGKLNQILSTTLITQAIIFANSGDTTQSISAALPSSVKYYKNRKPSENDESIKAFKSKAAKYLICTDILTSTRISDANVIISYDIPINPDNSLDEAKYKQRILCTACEHKCASVALLLTKSDELNYMKILRKMKLDSVAITSVDDIEDYLHS
jgi:superfamily II DNA/RNA helicase